MIEIQVSRGNLALDCFEFLWRVALPHLGRDAALEIWRGRGGTRWFWPKQTEPFFFPDSGAALQFVELPGDAIVGTLSFQLRYFVPALEHEAWDAINAASNAARGVARSERSCCISNVEAVQAALRLLAAEPWRQVIAEAARMFETGADPDERTLRLVSYAVELRQTLKMCARVFPQIAEELVALDAAYEPIKSATLLLDALFWDDFEIAPADALGWWLFPLELEYRCPNFLLDEALASHFGARPPVE